MVSFVIYDKLHPSSHAVDNMVKVFLGYRAPYALGFHEKTVRVGGTRNNGCKLPFEQRPGVLDEIKVRGVGRVVEVGDQGDAVCLLGSITGLRASGSTSGQGRVVRPHISVVAPASQSGLPATASELQEGTRPPRLG